MFRHIPRLVNTPFPVALTVALAAAPVLVIACAGDGAGQIGAPGASPMADEVIIISDPKPGCSAGAEAQNIDGAWQCVCIHPEICLFGGNGGMPSIEPGSGPGPTGPGPNGSSGTGGGGGEGGGPTNLEEFNGCMEYCRDAASTAYMNCVDQGFYTNDDCGVFIDDPDSQWCTGAMEACTVHNVGPDGSGWYKGNGKHGGPCKPITSPLCTASLKGCLNAWRQTEPTQCLDVEEAEGTACANGCVEMFPVDGESCTASVGQTVVHGTMDGGWCKGKEGISNCAVVTVNDCNVGE